MYDLAAIVPFKDAAEMTLTCVRSLVEYGPRMAEILLVSNNSSQHELELVRAGVADFANVRVVEYNHPFQYQKINNWAVTQTTAGTLLLLNNDTELVAESRGLLEKMYEQSQQPEVGVTGCLLLYAGGKKIQHAGIYLVSAGLADHLYAREPVARVRSAAGSPEFPYDVDQDRPLTAVTAAVAMVTRANFDAVGGFDERFIICGGDVDLCIRLNEAGHQTYYVGGGHILHKESISRKRVPIPYSDFYWSYNSYIKAFDLSKGDRFLGDAARLGGAR